MFKFLHPKEFCQRWIPQKLEEQPNPYRERLTGSEILSWLCLIGLVNYLSNPVLAQQLPPQLPLPSHQVSQTADAQLTLKEIVIIGSTAFSAEELNRLTAPWRGKTGSLQDLQADIQKIVQAINDLYLSRGYIASGAFFPPQDISQGTIRIQVVEGKLEKLEITGLQRLKTSYVSDRLLLANQPPLNLHRLQEALQLLQLDPLFQSVKAELKAGTAPELRILAVEIREAPALTVAVGYDNYQSPSIGIEQGTASLEQINLLGFGDRFWFEYNLTEGLDKYYLDYSFPVNPHNGSIRLHYEAGNSTVTQEPFSELDLSGEYQKASLTWREPIVQNLQTDLSWFVSFDWQQSQTFLLGQPFSFMPGISDGLSTISAVRLGTEWVSRSPERVFALRSQFSLGLDLFNATRNDSGRDGSFFSWQAQFQYLEKLTDNILFSTQLSGQFSPDSLLSLEQFQIGGIYSVRGYDYNFLQGDSGLAGTIELRLTLFDNESYGRMEVYPFFDFGAVWDNQSNLSSDLFTSTGFGLLWQRDPIRLRLDYAFPLTETQQEQNLYFSIQLRKAF